MANVTALPFRWHKNSQLLQWTFSSDVPGSSTHAHQVAGCYDGRLRCAPGHSLCLPSIGSVEITWSFLSVLLATIITASSATPNPILATFHLEFLSLSFRSRYSLLVITIVCYLIRFVLMRRQPSTIPPVRNLDELLSFFYQLHTFFQGLFGLFHSSSRTLQFPHYCRRLSPSRFR